jgi:hypothetical protein
VFGQLINCSCVFFSKALGTYFVAVVAASVGVGGVVVAAPKNR